MCIQSTEDDAYEQDIFSDAAGFQRASTPHFPVQDNSGLSSTAVHSRDVPRGILPRRAKVRAPSASPRHEGPTALAVVRRPRMIRSAHEADLPRPGSSSDTVKVNERLLSIATLLVDTYI